MADNDHLISQFADVTGVDTERARFFLESSAWQLEVALASFYENDGDDVSAPGLPMPQLDDDDPEIVDEIPAPQPRADAVPPPKPKAKSASGRNPRFGTVAGLHQQSNSDSSDEEGQAFYAGGSTTSGQQVLGPPTKKKDIVNEMFKSVQEHGAEVVDPRELAQGRGGPSFAGTGYRLGQSNNDTEIVGVPSLARAEPQTDVVLKLWKAGFSINDGEIRSFGDPANREFLECVKRGEVPQELIREARGEEVHLSMEDHRHEEYVPPKVQRQAFSGKGNMLGSPSPTTIGLTQPVTLADQEGNEAQARETVAVDQGLPTTTLQIRLADGSRLIGRFNTSHTIADVRAYIATARPQYQVQSYVLMTTFPSKELVDLAQTLDQAGILNAALLQRLK